MSDKISRKDFIKVSSQAAVSLGVSAAILGSSKTFAAEAKTVRIGMSAVGNRGRSLLDIILAMPGIKVPAVCDINLENLGLAKSMVEKAGQKKCEGYSNGPEDFKRLMDRDDLDAVIIATPWELHTPMAVYAMKAGKYAAVEVPAAITFEQCWDLVDTHERHDVPCMMLENWSFRRDNLAVLNMIRQGLFGEIVHCHCAHSHDCIDHWFFDPQGNMRWGGEVPGQAQRDQYPTHSLGPVLSWMDIGCGDYFDYLTSTATNSVGDQPLLHQEIRPGPSQRQASLHPGRHRHLGGPDPERQDHRHQLRHAASPALRQPLDDPGHPGHLQRTAESLYICRRKPEVSRMGAVRPLPGEVRPLLVEGHARQRRRSQPRRH